MASSCGNGDRNLADPIDGQPAWATTWNPLVVPGPTQVGL
jgi:hypothetical protein